MVFTKAGSATSSRYSRRREIYFQSAQPGEILVLQVRSIPEHGPFFF
jgi:hypothetical protein